MEDRSQRSYRNVLFPSDLQRPVLMLVVGTALVSLVSLGSFIYLQTTLLLQYAEKTGESERLVATLLEYGFLSGGLFLTGVVLMGVWALLVGHRLTGPIPRLKRELDRMYRKNEVRLLRLRTGDYLRPLIQRVNQVLWGVSEDSNWSSPDTPPDGTEGTTPDGS